MGATSAADLRRNIIKPQSHPIPFAGFWRRASAHAIDGSIILLMSFIASALIACLHLGGSAVLVVSAAAYVAITAAYFVLQESSERQATLGKRCLGLRVVSADSGKTLSGGQALLRNLYKIGLGVPVANILAQILTFSCLLIPFTEKKQAGQDFLAGTVVLAGPKPALYAQFEKLWFLAIFALVIGLPLLAYALGFGSTFDAGELIGKGARVKSVAPGAAKMQPQVTAISPSGLFESLTSTQQKGAPNPLDDIELRLEKTLNQKKFKR